MSCYCQAILQVSTNAQYRNSYFLWMFRVSQTYSVCIHTIFILYILQQRTYRGQHCRKFPATYSMSLLPHKTTSLRTALVQWYKHCLIYHVTYLDTRYSRWQHKSFVVAMYHDHNADGASCQSPRILEGKLLLLRLRVLERDVKHLREILAQVMGRGSLEPTQSHHYTQQSTVIFLACGYYLYIRYAPDGSTSIPFVHQVASHHLWCHTSGMFSWLMEVLIGW